MLCLLNGRAWVMVSSKPDDLTASPSTEPPMASITTFHRKLLKSSWAQAGQISSSWHGCHVTASWVSAF